MRPWLARLATCNMHKITTRMPCDTMRNASCVPQGNHATLRARRVAEGLARPTSLTDTWSPRSMRRTRHRSTSHAQGTHSILAIRCARVPFSVARTHARTHAHKDRPLHAEHDSACTSTRLHECTNTHAPTSTRGLCRHGHARCGALTHGHARTLWCTHPLYRVPLYEPCGLQLAGR